MLRFLKALKAGWMKFAHVLGVINTAILLTLVYVFLAGPMRLYLMLRGGKDSAASCWKARRAADPAMPERRRMRFQF